MDDINSYRTVGKYQISNMCLQSYPCQHSIINTETGETKKMYGSAIYTLLKEDKLSDAHFDEYAEYIRRHEHPTVGELADKRHYEKTMQENNLAHKKRKEEQDAITNQFKASSRLDKLKAKNNVVA
jgi:hypothetical protein